MFVYTYDLLCSISLWSAHIYTWHMDKSAHGIGGWHDTSGSAHVPRRFRLEPRDSANKGPASSGVPVPLSLSTSLSASRDFSDVDAYFARLVGTIILALRKEINQCHLALSPCVWRPITNAMRCHGLMVRTVIPFIYRWMQQNWYACMMWKDGQ